MSTLSIKNLDCLIETRFSQLGGSYVTIPRLAARASLRNFYQAKYPFAWVGGRVAYDA